MVTKPKQQNWNFEMQCVHELHNQYPITTDASQLHTVLSNPMLLMLLAAVKTY